jgi:hypothetical protein
MGIATTATAAEEKKHGQRSPCTRNGIGCFQRDAVGG